MEEEQGKDSLYIPQGLKKKREYFAGYGRYEFTITVIATLITIGICVLIYFITGSLVAAIFILLAVPSTTVLFVVKNESNISVVDQIKFMMDHAREQKKYYYVYQDEWNL